MKRTFQDIHIDIPGSWQPLKRDERRVIFGRRDGVMMLQIFPTETPPSDDAVQTMMTEFNRDTQEIFSSEDANIGGAPARVVSSRLNDGRVQLAAVIARANALIAFVSMGPDDDNPLPDAKQALNSITFGGGTTVTTPKVHRIHHADLKLSLGLPGGWEIAEVEDATMQVFAPEENDYRASLSFGVITAEQPVELTAVANLLQTQAAERLDTFEVVQEQTLQMSGANAYMARYYWQGRGLNISQLDVFIQPEPTRLIRIHGYSLRELEGKYIPLFVALLDTIQLD